MRKLVYAASGLILIAATFYLGSLVGRRGITAGGSKDAGPEASPLASDARELDVSAFSPGTVNVNPEKQQLAGIRVIEVERGPVTHVLRVLGRVTADNTRLYIVNATTPGWILDLANVTPGAMVKKGDFLASFYSPELRRVGQTYLYDLNTLDRLSGSPDSAAYKAALLEVSQGRDALVSLGMGQKQLDEIAKTRTWIQQIEITAPTTGIVIAWNIFPALKFVEGTEFFRIANLSRVWILLDVFENETKYLKPGVKSKVSLAGQQMVFEAVVSHVLPLFDPTTRTMKVRLEADNPDYALRPDMFVDVELPIELPATLAVPTDAVLDTGLKKTVFVDRGGGFFEPREVETGWRLGDKVEITRGLEPGERIVVSGTFLIDSESRLELAAAGMTETISQDPVCGLQVSVKKAAQAGRKSVYEGRTYYFCSDECKARFDENPEKYAASTSEDETPNGHEASPAPGDKTPKY
jgi:multidrug efflux pump subunit AcrA (membrane-fusion protein)/YHS domain-containing protein